MRKVCCTFGGKAYDAQIGRTWDIHKMVGLDDVLVFDDAWLLKHPFYELNRWIFEREPRNHMGHCCWKPLIILETMKELNDGDVVLYLDGDTAPIADLTPLFDIAAREKLVLFESQGNDNLRFTKRECFKTILGREPFTSQHACGRFQLFTVGDWRSLQILMEWQAYMLNPLCQFDEPSSTMTDQPEFFRNSADQSVLSMLAIKYNIPLHREACQFGFPIQPNCGQPGDDYPQLFEQVWCDGDRNDLSGSVYRNV
jgi:hypothetical protein